MAITTDDFNKIWASTSPLTPYSFSASQYKEGWNFIGSTPPSRQMWDFLQKNNDEKMQYLLNNFDNYLPLAGGTMAGSIQYINNGKVFAIGNTTTGNVDLGWNWENRDGAGLGLKSTDYGGNGSTNAGGFSLFARDSANSCSLDGKPDGTLTWNDKEVERVNAKGTHYIRYESGLQICWGYADTPSNGIFTVTFSSAFINTSYAMNVTGVPASTGTASSRMTSLSGVSGDRTTTSWKGTIVSASNTVVATGVIYIAIGLWK